MEKKEYIKPEIAVLQMETQAILVVSNTIPKATQGKPAISVRKT